MYVPTPEAVSAQYTHPNVADGIRQPALAASFGPGIDALHCNNGLGQRCLSTAWPAPPRTVNVLSPVPPNRHELLDDTRHGKSPFRFSFFVCRLSFVVFTRDFNVAFTIHSTWQCDELPRSSQEIGNKLKKNPATETLFAVSPRAHWVWLLAANGFSIPIPKIAVRRNAKPCNALEQQRLADVQTDAASTATCDSIEWPAGRRHPLAGTGCLARA